MRWSFHQLLFCSKYGRKLPVNKRVNPSIRVFKFDSFKFNELELNSIWTNPKYLVCEARALLIQNLMSSSRIEPRCLSSTDYTNQTYTYKLSLSITPSRATTNLSSGHKSKGKTRHWQWGRMWRIIDIWLNWSEPTKLKPHLVLSVSVLIWSYVCFCVFVMACHFCHCPTSRDKFSRDQQRCGTLIHRPDQQYPDRMILC